MKPFAESCQQNWQPILEVFKAQLPTGKLLEIGSGTGQHAVYCTPHLPDVLWQTSERAEHLEGVGQWLVDANPRVLSPLELDVMEPSNWPDDHYHMMFTANTFHIMPWQGVEACLRLAAQQLYTGGVFLVYGPFNYDGDYTSESNAQFDQWLKAQDPTRGIRDIEALKAFAVTVGLSLKDDIEMPANNRILLWHKD